MTPPPIKSGRGLSTLVAETLAFFKAAPDSLRDHLNRDEIVRVCLTALTTGGGIYGLLEGIMRSAGHVFPASSDAALAAVVFATILDSRRRLGHGTTPERTERFPGRPRR